MWRANWLTRNRVRRAEASVRPLSYGPKRIVWCYFFLPDPKVGCQPAVAPFWLGAAAMILTLSFFGFFVSRLLLAMPTPWFGEAALFEVE
jgi:hypothetical protein